jgi:hypothetical protein
VWHRYLCHTDKDSSKKEIDVKMRTAEQFLRRLAIPVAGIDLVDVEVVAIWKSC